MKRRRILRSALAGSLGGARIFLWLSNDSGDDSNVYVCSTRGSQRTLSFSLAPQERAYVSLSYSENIRLSYILRTKDDVPVSISVFKHDGSVTGPDTTRTYYPELSHTQRSKVSDSKVVLTGAGQYAMMITNPADGTVNPLDDGPEAHVKYSFIASETKPAE
jgi:hypothetical protein